MEEYKVRVVKKYAPIDAADEIEKACNNKARDGWSLSHAISVGPWADEDHYYVYLIFRRNVEVTPH